MSWHHFGLDMSDQDNTSRNGPESEYIHMTRYEQAIAEKTRRSTVQRVALAGTGKFLLAHVVSATMTQQLGVPQYINSVRQLSYTIIYPEGPAGFVTIVFVAAVFGLIEVPRAEVNKWVRYFVTVATILGAVASFAVYSRRIRELGEPNALEAALVKAGSKGFGRAYFRRRMSKYIINATIDSCLLLGLIVLLEHAPGPLKVSINSYWNFVPLVLLMAGISAILHRFDSDPSDSMTWKSVAEADDTRPRLTEMFDDLFP